jgi:hypothetical protein
MGKRYGDIEGEALGDEYGSISPPFSGKDAEAMTGDGAQIGHAQRQGVELSCQKKLSQPNMAKFLAAVSDTISESMAVPQVSGSGQLDSEFGLRCVGTRPTQQSSYS